MTELEYIKLLLLGKTCNDCMIFQVAYKLQDLKQKNETKCACVRHGKIVEIITPICMEFIDDRK